MPMQILYHNMISLKIKRAKSREQQDYERNININSQDLKAWFLKYRTDLLLRTQALPLAFRCLAYHDTRFKLQKTTLSRRYIAAKSLLGEPTFFRHANNSEPWMCLVRAMLACLAVRTMIPETGSYLFLNIYHADKGYNPLGTLPTPIPTMLNETQQSDSPKKLSASNSSTGIVNT
ncbi:hypothetical protein ROZALSC1DRAFT_23603 [Rozella allomycis CSF55]|uniref:Uncharacterized protein n=1 Tax=Rozella allomycis (strain CSF55) TaxID=988480 RepID=A0A4P9YFK1_ROZAC|nr:hypothetical protein ROZALSC1DRAFT_23603 [Rozella allomycis CSF55]